MSRMIKPRLSFVIPCYNDAQTIGRVIAEADTIGRKWLKAWEIVVCNDGSSDETGTQLDSLKKRYPRLRVIINKENKGYGATIKELYYAAKYDWLFSIPGDHQIKPAELLTLLPYAHKGDMIIGWRRNRHDPPERLRQSRLYNWLLTLLFGLHLHDVNSVRLMRTSILPTIVLQSHSAFVDAELAIASRKRGYRVLEVPIGHLKRDGTRGGGGSWKTIFPTIWEMVWYKLHNPTNTTNKPILPMNEKMF